MELKSNNKKITNYELYGEKANSPILLIHGLGAELNSWEYQIDELIRQNFYVIVLDMYGHGKSSLLDSDSLAEWDQQILELVDYLKIENFSICGVSMGGVIAQHFTITYPQKINSLIISDSFCELKTVNEKLLGFSQIAGFHLFKLFGNKTFAKGMAAAYKKDFASNAQSYMYQQGLKADFDQLLKARKAINKVDLLSKLEKLSIPSLIIVGKCFGDSFVDINRKIADAIPNSKFVPLENSVDPSPLVNPTEFNKEVILFLKRINN